MPNLPGSVTDIADHLLATDPYLATLAERLWREQRRLKRAVGSEAYRVYLRIEEITNERLLALAERMWAVARAQERRRHRAQARHGRVGASNTASPGGSSHR
jgi:hypothetical protein